MHKNIPFVFFGTSHFSVIVLDELKSAGYVPALVVTQEDKPQGRHMTITPPPVKVWAEQNNVPVIQPKSLKDVSVSSELSANSYDLFIVASYGKIIPQAILDIPKYQTLNVHPSLLPKLRGPSPIQGAILNELETGVTIMRLNSKMDEGPIVVQEKVLIPNWPPYANELEETLAHSGGALLAGVIPKWIDGSVTEIPQDDSLATYCKIIQKTDAQVDLSDSPEVNLRKIRAYVGWPNAYTHISHNGKELRLIVKSAHLEEGKLILDRIVPEGRKEMNWQDFERGLHSTQS